MIVISRAYRITKCLVLLTFSIVVCFLTAGCATPYVKLSGDRLFPERPEVFEVQPGGPYSVDTGIDFNAVYWNVHTWGGRPWYRVLRFWPNGRVLLRGMWDKPPDGQNAESFGGPEEGQAKVGYYRIDGSTLIIEWFGHRAAQVSFPNVGFTKEKVRIERDEIVVLERNDRGWNSPRPVSGDEHYKRQTVGPLRRQSDW